MLDINLIRQQPEVIAAALKKRGADVDFTEIISADDDRRRTIKLVEDMKAERNAVSAGVPKLKAEGKPVDEIIAKMKALGEKIAEGDALVNDLNLRIKDYLCRLPNIPDTDLEAGGKENNKVIEEYGKQPKFDFEPLDHVTLCTKLGLIDYERGAKLAGSGHWIYRGTGARLEWALLNFFISEHIKDGYEFVLLPHMLNYNCGYGAGQFPKFNDDVFWLESKEEQDKRFLLPTAETALVNMYANEIIDLQKLPVKLAGYTPCYRKEAGSYRSEERGMIRGHQFNKVEMVQITQPSESINAFKELVNKAADLVRKLGLHFRISKLAAGDCSAGMARTYDIEVWIPSMGIYKEVSSISNANDYQARRNNTKYRDLTGKPQFVHTLNASGLATSRILPAIIEQYQNSDGTVRVPDVLQKFLDGQQIIGAKK